MEPLGFSSIFAFLALLHGFSLPFILIFKNQKEIKKIKKLSLLRDRTLSPLQMSEL